jgi:hypothetical protein
VGRGGRLDGRALWDRGLVVVVSVLLLFHGPGRSARYLEGGRTFSAAFKVLSTSRLCCSFSIISSVREVTVPLRFEISDNNDLNDLFD